MRALLLKVAGNASVELRLFFVGLEATVSHLGGGINKLECDLLESVTGGLGQQRLTEGDTSFPGTTDGTLNHDPVLVDFTVMREATKRSDGLLSEIVLSVGVILGLLKFHTVDLLVDLRAVMVTVLTSTRNLELHTSWMPCSDTSDLAETTMGLTRETGHTPTSHNTVNTTTLGHTNNIDHGVLGENVSDANLALEETLAVVNLFSDILSTVDLDFLEVCLLLTDLSLLDLSMNEETDGRAVLFGTLNLGIHFVVGVLFGVVRESFLLGLIPVLVESALDGVSQVSSEDRGQSAETTRSLDVTDETNCDNRRSFENGHCLNDVLLVQLGTRLVHLTHDMSHTSLETHKSGHVAWLRVIVFWEGFDLSVVVLRALLG